MAEQRLLAAVAAYLEKYYREEKLEVFGAPMCQAAPAAPRKAEPEARPGAAASAAPRKLASLPQKTALRAAAPAKSGRRQQLEDLLENMGESFTQMLLRLIDERGMTDPQVYHRANIDRKLFSKIRKNVHYSPNKRTVVALALALELTVEETTELLKTAGFSLSNSSRADLIIRFSLENQIYDVMQVNELLFHYEEPLLGSV